MKEDFKKRIQRKGQNIAELNVSKSDVVKKLVFMFAYC